MGLFGKSKEELALEQIEKKDRRMDEKDETIHRLMDKCL